MRRCGCALIVICSSLLPSLAATAARPLSHFPVYVDGAVEGSVALFDLDGDGMKEVVACAGEYVTALRVDNSLVPGFPVFIGSPAAGSPAVVELRPGEPAILAVSREGQVHLLRSDGSAFPGFPLSLGGSARAGGSLVDVDGDGVAEL
ncbi:MAG: hypothetical protein ACOCVR_04260, partial [Myxococcota bacterium]